MYIMANGEIDIQVPSTEYEHSFKVPIKYKIYLAIAFIIFLILVIISGKILSDLNKATCSTDPGVVSGKKWSKWLVGISTVGMIVTLIGLIVILFMKL